MIRQASEHYIFLNDTSVKFQHTQLSMKDILNLKECN